MNSVRAQSQISLADFTTWRVGGPAEWLAEPASLEELTNLLRWARERGICSRVIGAGSNLLIHDSGLSGLSICLRKLQGSKLDPQTGIIEAFAGEPIPSLARRAARTGLHGLEWAVGIPGTVGGAAVMNAGAQGGCTADWLASVRVLSLDGGEIFNLNCNELNFAYRHSRLQSEPLVVLSARFHLEAGHDPRELGRTTSRNLSHCTSTQPYQLPSCGSVFRNPEPLKAGRLIEGLGLKGWRVGGAEVSSVHANFIVNRGGATASDINALIELVQKRVEQAHGLILHPEVKRLGFTASA